MKKIIYGLTSILGIIATGLAIRCHFYPGTALLAVTITAVTFFYHFAMRLTIGVAVNLIVKNNVDFSKKWFKELSFEPKLYSFLKVKKWKKYMPTFSIDTFDVSKRSLEEIAKATCQSEIVHEIIVLLSFLPILLAIPFGTLAVFVVTSVFASLFDCLFVILQRYNRPRIIKLLNKKATKRA